LHETTEEELVAPKACTFSVVEEQEPAKRGRGGSTSQDNRQNSKGRAKGQRVKKEVLVNAPALLEHSLEVEMHIRMKLHADGSNRREPFRTSCSPKTTQLHPSIQRKIIFLHCSSSGNNAREWRVQKNAHAHAHTHKLVEYPTHRV
jgi:hypothetical protein